MGTYTNLQIHVVFSTKKRLPSITHEFESRLYGYIGGIIHNLKSVLCEINGMDDHVHLLIRLSPTISVSKLIREIKSESSLWTHKTFPEKIGFEWQDGYAAFSVSESKIDDVRQYIKNQKEHHKKVNFKEELIKFFKKHKVEYDERFI